MALPSLTWLVWCLGALLGCAILAPARAQQPVPATAPAPTAAPAPLPTVPLVLEAGVGRLISLPGPAATILAADPRIARVQPASPTSLFVMGVAAGHTTVVATAEDGTPVAELDITVQPGSGILGPPTPAAGTLGGAAPQPTLNPAAIETAIRRSFRGMGGVRVIAAGPHTLVLTGQVGNAADAQRAETVARGYAGEQREVVNNLALLSSVKVNVRVRVAEVSRQVTRELGFNWQAFGKIGNFVLGLRSGSSASTVLGAISGAAAGSGLSSSPTRFGLERLAYDRRCAVGERDRSRLPSGLRKSLFGLQDPYGV